MSVMPTKGKFGKAAEGVRRFQAVLEEDRRSLGCTIARVPFGVEALGKMVRLRVKGELRGPGGSTEFRTSLFPETAVSAPGTEGAFYLLVGRRMLAAAGLGLGATAEFWLQADLEPREAELPDELAILLGDEPGLLAWYAALGEYTRREIGKWVNGVQGDEARIRRAQQMAERLLATMQGERELPRGIAEAFRRRPRAKAGWAKMTEAQQRGELMAVFSYRTPDSRSKRIGKLCDLAETKA